jgi:hypothetical protein
MGVDGFPDPAVHRFCYRCRDWFEPDEGSTVPDGRWRPLDWVRARIEVPLVGREIFMCARCRRARKKIRGVVVALIFALIFAASAYAFCVTYERARAGYERHVR